MRNAQSGTLLYCEGCKCSKHQEVHQFLFRTGPDGQPSRSIFFSFSFFAHCLNHQRRKNRNMEEAPYRPLSAPAVLTAHAANNSNASTPSVESMSGVLESLENQRYGMSAAGEVNPRVPTSKIASRFSYDQRQQLSSQPYAVVAAMGGRSRRENGGPEAATDTVTNSITTDVERGPLENIEMNAEELKRESHRTYRQSTASSDVLPNEGFINPAMVSLQQPSREPTLFERLAQCHQQQLAAKSSEVLQSRHDRDGSHFRMRVVQQPPPPSDATSEKAAAVTIQKEMRRALAAVRGTRLLGLLHLFRTECLYPRLPTLLLGSARGSSVSPLAYLMECALEYEYMLQVESMTRRIVAEGRSRGRERFGDGSRWTHRRFCLGDAELSDLHEQTQQRISEGDRTVTSEQEVHGGLESLLSPVDYTVLQERLAAAVPPVGGVSKSAVDTFSSVASYLTEESFLYSVALAAQRQRATTKNKSTNRGTSSASISSAATAYSAYSEPQRVEDLPSTATLRSESDRIRSTLQSKLVDETTARTNVEVEALIRSVPTTWFAGAEKSSSVEYVEGVVRACTDADQGTGELTEAPSFSLMTAATATAQPISAADAERALAQLWQRLDPEKQKERAESRRSAKRRIQGAEYSSSESDASDDERELLVRIGVVVSEHQNKELLLRQQSLPSGGDDEFNSEVYLRRQKLKEQEAWVRSVRIHTSAEASPQRLPTESHFDPCSWGLDGSPQSFADASKLLSGRALTEAAEASATELRSSVIPLGGGGSRWHTKSEVCVVCEMDAEGVVRCLCGNWLHLECSFDFDVDRPRGSSCDIIKCCSLCKQKAS